jgi:hypothetical protein
MIFFRKRLATPISAQNKRFWAERNRALWEKSVAKFIFRYILEQDFDTIVELKGIKVFSEVLNWILISVAGGRVLIATMIINWIINKKGGLICF